jgi:spore coat protein U-like protein
VTTTCTLAAPYNIGLNAGTGAGATVAARKMTSGANLLTYSLFQDAARLVVWGNTIGTDTVALVGTGLAVPTTVFGRIPALQNVAVGSYTDTITATVTF